MSSYTNIDEYMVTVEPSQRVVLQNLRDFIKKLVPEAEETISYQLPAFKHKSKLFAGFAAYKNHYSFFPMDGGVLDKFSVELTNFNYSKGALQFTPENPVPDELLERIIRFKLEKNDTIILAKKKK